MRNRYLRRQTVGAGIAFFLVAGVGVAVVALSPIRSASANPPVTTSFYENASSSAIPGTLAQQCQSLGLQGQAGVSIMDFGRTAYNGSTPGFIDFGGYFLSVNDVYAAMQQCEYAYAAYNPYHTFMYFAIGTNDSYTNGSPQCGYGNCSYTVPNYQTWGQQWASLQIYSQNYDNQMGYNGWSNIWGGNDAEPAWDPNWANTDYMDYGWNLVTSASLVDYGSLDPGYWTNAHMLQEAWSWPDDWPFGEIYYASQAQQWTNLAVYACNVANAMAILGVTTENGYGGTLSAAASYNDLLYDLQNSGNGCTYVSSISYETSI